MHPIDMLFDLLSSPQAESNKVAATAAAKAAARGLTNGQVSGAVKRRALKIGNRVAQLNKRASVVISRLNRLVAGEPTIVIPTFTESAMALARKSGKILSANVKKKQSFRLSQIQKIRKRLKGQLRKEQRKDLFCGDDYYAEDLATVTRAPSTTLDEPTVSNVRLMEQFLNDLQVQEFNGMIASICDLF